MTAQIRYATPEDLPAVQSLLIADAAARARSDAQLWRMAEDAPNRVAQTFASEAKNGGNVRWLVAETANRVCGVARFGLIPCPPIYHLAGSNAFLLFEDTAVDGAAPDHTFRRLIERAEREAKALGAVIDLAACALFQHDKLNALMASGYEIVTHYFVHHGVADAPLPATIRPAMSVDVEGIVAMGRQSQQALCAANAQMWAPHPDPPARFAAWMGYALTLADRRIFIGERKAGFIVAQPISPFHLPLTAARDHVGLIDDFWADEFGDGTTRDAQDLLFAAGGEFARRGKTVSVAVCPAAWPAKQEALRAHGYAPAYAWLVKS